MLRGREGVVAGKYEPLADHLRAAAAEGHQLVEVAFGTVDRLVSGLPPSARRLRTWWANSSHAQATAWRDAGWHVHRVDLPGGRVVFAAGQVGGTSVARGRDDRAATPERRLPRTSAADSMPSVSDLPVLDVVHAAVRFSWHDAGPVTLDATGKPTFPKLPAAPGLYRIALTGRPAQTRPRVYVGETDNLRRRLAWNYRSPGPGQRTSLRVNALLRGHLADGGVVRLSVAAEVSVTLADVVGPQPLDLAQKSARLLAESAAIVLARHHDDADIENLG